MGKFFAPLWVFILGQGALLVVGVFMPTIQTSTTALAANTTGWATTNVWGWSWLMTNGVVRFLIYVGLELAVLFAAGMTLWYNTRRQAI